MKTKILLILCCTLLTACAAQPRKPAPVPAEKPIPLIASRAAPGIAADASGEIDALLAYHQWLRESTPAELAKEQAALHAQPKTVQSALKKSMLLALSHNSDDLARAQALIDGVVKSPEPEALLVKPLAQMLAFNYTEMRRLSEQADKITQQAKDSQRRTEQLNEKLEALKAIERTLPARPNGAAPVPLTKGTGTP
jgi:hypothetical protein